MVKKDKRDREATSESACEDWRKEIVGKKVEENVGVLTRAMSRKEKEEEKEALAGVGNLFPQEDMSSDRQHSSVVDEGTDTSSEEGNTGLLEGKAKRKLGEKVDAKTSALVNGTHDTASGCGGSKGEVPLPVSQEVMRREQESDSEPNALFLKALTVEEAKESTRLYVDQGLLERKWTSIDAPAEEG